MGTFIKGILGGFSGLVGTVIGSNWRTLDVMKSRPKKSGKPPVQAQIDQRFIFAMVVAFLSKIEKIVSIGFRSNTGVTTPMNAAVKYNIAQAVTGISPVFNIDYANVALSKGPLEIAYDAALVAEAGRLLHVTWLPEPGDPTDPAVVESNADQAMLVVYNPERNLFLRAPATTRGAGKLDVKLVFLFDGINHAWLFFAEKKGKKVSNTQYLGQFESIV